jgi:hypothetical protein
MQEIQTIGENNTDFMQEIKQYTRTNGECIPEFTQEVKEETQTNIRCNIELDLQELKQEIKTIVESTRKLKQEIQTIIESIRELKREIQTSSKSIQEKQETPTNPERNIESVQELKQITQTNIESVQESKQVTHTNIESTQEIKQEAQTNIECNFESTQQLKQETQIKTINKIPDSPIIKIAKNLKISNKFKQKGRNNDAIEEDAGKRYFKCIMINDEDTAVNIGRFSGKKPKQAASKACTHLYENRKNSGEIPEQIIYCMHECTRSNKKKKKYFYVGKRLKLVEPVEIEINKIDPETNKKMVITYLYNNSVTKLDNFECPEYNILNNYDHE